MKLTENLVKTIYSKLKDKAFKAYNKGNYDSCLKYASTACFTAYTFYLGYYDPDIESLNKSLAKHIIRPDKDSGSYVANNNRVVLFDSFSQDTQGLSMQYLNAIIAGGYELLYITEFNLNDPRAKLIKKTLNYYPKATVVSLPKSLKGMARAQYIYGKIYDYHPGRLFMHIFPSSMVPVVAFNALPKEIVRYQINLTDHTFWVGTSCTDYTFEFREYGANLSIQYRGIPEERILYLPYYPIMNDTDFAGFPTEADDKIKIFSGASYYKIIDENDTFFKLNKAILDANPEVVTLFAGGGDRSVLDTLIDKYDLRGRFIPIGQRNDIFECYKHSDIYLSTYPLFGGLMSQYAAHASLPILALEKQGGGVVEEVVCQKKKERITIPEIDDVVAEAKHLIKDSDYRKQRGEAMKACVIDKDEFNLSFKKAVETNLSPCRFEIEPNVKLHHLDINNKLKLINKNKSYHLTLYKTLSKIELLSHPSLPFEAFLFRLKSSRFGKYLK